MAHGPHATVLDLRFAVPHEWPAACKFSQRLGQRAATRLVEEVADADIRRLKTAISPVTKKPNTMTRTAPIAQTVQTAIERPSAIAGAHSSTV